MYFYLKDESRIAAKSRLGEDAEMLVTVATLLSSFFEFSEVISHLYNPCYSTLNKCRKGGYHDGAPKAKRYQAATIIEEARRIRKGT